MKRNYVFTYGTLLKGERNHHLISDADFVCTGCIRGFKMFNLGAYPGIEYGDGRVLGELYLVDDLTLEKLDILEEEGSLYIRTTSRVYTDDNEYEAYVYVYNHEVENPNYLGDRIYSWRNRK